MPQARGRGAPEFFFFTNEIARWAQVGKGSLTRELERLQRAAPQTQTLALDACGHSPHRDQPDALTTALVSVMPADTLSPPPTVMTGVSLVPAIVTVTICDALPS